MSNNFFNDEKTSLIFSDLINTKTLGSVASVPVVSLVHAQNAANQAYLNYLRDIFIDKQGQLNSVELQLPNKNGGEEKSSVRLPLIAILTHPAIAIQDAKVEYTVNVIDKKSAGTSQSKGKAPAASTSTSTEVAPETEGATSTASGSTGDVLNWSASLSCSSERKRSTDTTASLTFVTNIARMPPSEGMSRLIDAILA
jgi:hypothetical protein